MPSPAPSSFRRVTYDGKVLGRASCVRPCDKQDPTATWVLFRETRGLPSSYRGKPMFMYQRVGLIPCTRIWETQSCPCSFNTMAWLVVPTQWQPPSQSEEKQLPMFTNWELSCRNEFLIFLVEQGEEMARLYSYEPCVV